MSQFPAIEVAEIWQARAALRDSKQALRDAKQALRDAKGGVSDSSGASERAVRKAERRVAAATAALVKARELCDRLGEHPTPRTPYRPAEAPGSPRALAMPPMSA